MFFRQPNRHIEALPDGTIICPADGTIVVIEEVMESEYFKEMRQQVSIFMSITNVHINWYPVSGVIRYVKYHAGKYLVAWHPKSSELNERNSIVIGTQKGDILVRQVAGFVARKIYSTAGIDQKVKKGEQIRDDQIRLPR
ncbi:MAG: phosphatidylserine decarboxylase [Bacteroidales bacterium]|nr:phosphatidylserine decarboxylase [Bacteroidales bacterium]